MVTMLEVITGHLFHHKIPWLLRGHDTVEERSSGLGIFKTEHSHLGKLRVV